MPLRRGDGPLHAQVERTLREAIRAGRLMPDTALPSTRVLARTLGISRGVVFEAYAQLAAEGYLVARQGAATRVASRAVSEPPRARPARLLRDLAGAHDLMPGRPDLSAFPREVWLASWRRALRRVPDAALGYPDPRGTVELRDALSSYLGRARAVVPDPQRTVITAGVTQGVVLLARALREQGHSLLAVEDPGFHLHRWSVERAGLRTVGVRVDAEGLDVDALAATGARAVLTTPAHQMPTGVVLTPARRAALLVWADEVDGLVIEDDYDAEYRFDREPVGALQGVDPQRVAYAGSASKTLANALRLGWLVLPERLARAVGLGARRCRRGRTRPRAARLRGPPGARRHRPPPAPHPAALSPPPGCLGRRPGRAPPDGRGRGGGCRAARHGPPARESRRGEGPRRAP